MAARADSNVVPITQERSDMPRPSVISAVKEHFEDFLEELESLYLAIQEPRTVTWPAMSDGKVKLRGIATAFGLKQAHEKYLYELPGLSSLVNLVAEGQGLMPTQPFTRSPCRLHPTDRTWLGTTGAIPTMASIAPGPGIRCLGRLCRGQARPVPEPWAGMPRVLLGYPRQTPGAACAGSAGSLGQTTAVPGYRPIAG